MQLQDVVRPDIKKVRSPLRKKKADFGRVGSALAWMTSTKPI
jgi:hypothetical protein